MPTIMELFKGSPQDEVVKTDSNKSKSGFKQNVTNFVQQDLSGVRLKSLAEINSPTLYGTGAIAIGKRATTDSDDLRTIKQTNKYFEDNDIAINKKSIIPITQLPTRVAALADPLGVHGKRINFKKNPSNEAITQDSWGKNGTELGKLLKQAQGPPGAAGAQLAGAALKLAKDKLREKIFGKKPDYPTVPLGPVTYSDVTSKTDSTPNTRSEYLKSKEDELLGNMGIGVETEDPRQRINKKSKKPELATRTPAFFVTEKDSGSAIGKLQVPFWIQALNENAEFKWGTGTPGTLTDRKMFFRTVVSGISETVTPSWEGSKFIGNPYEYFIYTGVARSVSFNLNLYCMDENELKLNWQRMEFLTRQVYPHIQDNVMNAPFIKFQLGDMYKDRIGFIESLGYTVPDNGTWSIDGDGLKLPKFIDVALTIKLIETPGSEEKIYDFTSNAIETF